MLHISLHVIPALNIRPISAYYPTSACDTFHCILSQLGIFHSPVHSIPICMFFVFLHIIPALHITHPFAHHPSSAYYASLCILLYRTQGAEGSQPALEIKRSEDMNKAYKIKDVNVRMNVIYNKCEWYCCVLYVAEERSEGKDVGWNVSSCH
jgi:hypothetical protein